MLTILTLHLKVVKMVAWGHGAFAVSHGAEEDGADVSTKGMGRYGAVERKRDVSMLLVFRHWEYCRRIGLLLGFAINPGGSVRLGEKRVAGFNG